MGDTSFFPGQLAGCAPMRARTPAKSMASGYPNVHQFQLDRRTDPIVSLKWVCLCLSWYPFEFWLQRETQRTPTIPGKKKKETTRKKQRKTRRRANVDNSGISCCVFGLVSPVGSAAYLVPCIERATRKAAKPILGFGLVCHRPDFFCCWQIPRGKRP